MAVYLVTAPIGITELIGSMTLGILIITGDPEPELLDRLKLVRGHIARILVDIDTTVAFMWSLAIGGISAVND